MSHINTHPNTPFGKELFRLGLWHSTVEDAVESLYNKLHEVEKTAVKTSSGWIAIVNSTIGKTPDFVFELFQAKFPDITKEKVTEFLNNVNAKINALDVVIPDDYGTALTKLQEYLGKYQGNEWIAITRAVVSIATDILLKGNSPIQAIGTVLEFVYLTFVKGIVAA